MKAKKIETPQTADTVGLERGKGVGGGRGGGGGGRRRRVWREAEMGEKREEGKSESGRGKAGWGGR